MVNIIKSTDHPSTLAILAALGLFMAGCVHAQTPAPLGSSSTAAPEWTAMTAAELEALLGPIALYPDDLIAIVLPASTFPLQIVQASRYLEDRNSNAALQPDESWDDSVVALLNYPEALALLNDDLDWTYALGEAVVYQQGDVLNAIQSFRDRAYAAGNLATDERQVIAAADDGAITITPADPEVIYVPYYDPVRVVVHSRVPSYYYYPYAYPSYYYPYPAGYSFGSGFFWGVTTAFLVSWPDHYLHVHHNSHYGHPYYGYNYYTPWYARTNVYVNVNNYGNYNRWQPSYRHGGRPAHPASYSRLRDTTVVRTPSERRIRSGWVPNQPAAGVSNQPRRAVANSGVDDGRARRSTATGSTATGSTATSANAAAQARRIRSGRYDANANGALSDTDASRERSGSAVTNNGRASANSTPGRSVTGTTQRPRGTTAATATGTDSRYSRSRTARLETRGNSRLSSGASESSATRSRVQAPSPGTTTGVRVAPQRGARSATRSQQAASPAAVAAQRNPTPTFGRVAPERGASSAARGQQAAPPAARIPQRGSTPAFSRGTPAPAAAAAAGRSGMRREQPMSPPSAQRQVQSQPAAPAGANAGRAPAVARQNNGAAAPQSNGRPGGIQQNRRAK